MKHLLFLICFFSVALVSTAQEAVLPPYKKHPNVPPFEITTVNKQVINKSHLKARSTVVMFFSPTCDHCQKQIRDMQKQYDKLQNFEIVLACYVKPAELQKFITEYDMNKYPHFKIGIDTKYILPPFYNIKSLPFIALYDKKGKLIQVKEGNMNVDEMIKALE